MSYQWSIKKESQALKKLINSGVNNIIATNVPDEGLLPGLTPAQRQKASQIVISYNKQWTKMIDNINLTYNNIIKKYDLFSFMRKSYSKFLNLKYNVSDPAFILGRENIFNKVAISYADYNKGVSDDNVDKYYFFDNIHPTRVIHNWWGNDMYKKIFN